MKLGIMQPYFLPYLGYWQLMNAVDEYVVYDDVNFIKGGWINRNRILIGGEPKFLNLPMLGASSNVLINQVHVNRDEHLLAKNLRMIENAYRKAPQFETVYPLMEQVLRGPLTDSEEMPISTFILHSFELLADYMDIHTKLHVSSELEKDNSLHGQDKVLAICKLLGATEYYNAADGVELYDFTCFAEQGVALKFVEMQDVPYAQYGNAFVPRLSILDVLMFNDRESVKRKLQEFTLVEK